MPSLDRTGALAGAPSLAALRRWWWLPLLGALLGALLGYLAGSRSTYTATALIQSHVQGVEAQAVAQGAQAALAGIETSEVYTKAAPALGTTADDLQSRTRTAIVGDSSIISVAVEAPNRGTAVAQANAVARTAVEVAQARVDADLTGLRDRTLALLREGPVASLPKVTGKQSAGDVASLVANGQAELSRQQAIGQALGQAQSARVTGQGTIGLLQAADVASVSKDVSKSVTAMSLAAGALLGVAGALLLGTRRDRARSVAQLRSLYPAATVVPRPELATLLAHELPRHQRVLVVAHGGGLADEVRADAGTTPVVVADPSSSLVGRLDRDPGTLTLVDVPTGTPVTVLDRLGRETGDDAVLVLRD